MKFYNKLGFRITTIFMIPLVVISIIISSIIYKTNSELAEAQSRENIQKEVFKYVEFFDKKMNSIAEVALTDASRIAESEKLDDDQIIKITKENIEIDSFIFGSGVFFAKYTYPKDREVVFYYSHLQDGDTVSYVVSSSDDENYFNYHDNQPGWWKEPKDTHLPGWTDPYVDSLSGNTHMVTYYQPFFLNDVFGGIVTIDISLDKLETLLVDNKDFFSSSGSC